MISLIEYQPKTRALHEAARQEVHRIVARNHGFDPSNPDSFDEWDTVNTVDQVGKIFDAMNAFLGSVGLVTLGLGAIGIINIMLVAVADRTREIGLRKALGATNASIMFQFFVEGAFLTLLSGTIGIGVAAGLMALLCGCDSGRWIRSAEAGGVDGGVGGGVAGGCGSGGGIVSGAAGGDAAAGGGAAEGVESSGQWSVGSDQLTTFRHGSCDLRGFKPKIFNTERITG